MWMPYNALDKLLLELREVQQTSYFLQVCIIIVFCFIFRTLIKLEGQTVSGRCSLKLKFYERK